MNILTACSNKPKMLISPVFPHLVVREERPLPMAGSHRA
jgi:hypothetical protein